MEIAEMREYFARKGVSQLEVGRFIGVDGRTIRRWFSEEGSAPKLFELAIKADIFNVEARPTDRVVNRLVLKEKP